MVFSLCSPLSAAPCLHVGKMNTACAQAGRGTGSSSESIAPVPFPHLRKITHLYKSIREALLSQQDLLCLLPAQITLARFPADNIPVRFPFSPSFSGIGCRRFAFVVRLEPQNPTTWL